MSAEDQPHDVLVVGAGPAGLTAAIYLARFHLDVAVVDAGASRAAMIPRTHNHAGFPGGISGVALLERMREQAAEFGVGVVPGTIEALTHDGDLFATAFDERTLRARAVLLATGVVNHRPEVADDRHDEALARGLLRYCPVCDGYEVTDQKVAVIGRQTHGHNEALFLRMYSRDVTLIAPEAGLDLTAEERANLDALGIALVEGPCGPLRPEHDGIVVPLPDGPRRFDTVYPALGSAIRSELARALDAEASEEGCLVVDPHCRTTIPGLYAAGDVTLGLDQISAAMGDAARAATTIRNDLAEKRTLAR